MALNYLGQEINPNTRPQAQAGGYMGAPQQTQSQPPPVQGMDMAKIFGMMMQAAQQQQQGQLGQQQNFFDNTNALGRTAIANQRPMGLTPENQWSQMFGGNAASAMNPEARMQSQGGSAINQWRDPMQFQGSLPPQQSPMDAAVQASPPAWQPNYDFAMPQPLTSPFNDAYAKTDPANLQRNKQIYAPGGASRLRKGSSFGMQASR